MIEPERLQELSDAPERDGDYVLYWMQQSQRARFNPALETAVGAANRLGIPVLVGFGLSDAYPEANARHYTFMLEGLREVEAELRRHGIGFVVEKGEPVDVALRLAGRAALVVCDRGYLTHQKAWRRKLASKAGCRVIQVEGDAVVPVAVVSDKREVAARTLRPRLMRRVDDFLHPLRPVKPAMPATRLKLPSSLDLSDIPAVIAGLGIDRSVGPVAASPGGTAEAERRLKRFIATALDHYAEDRGEPAAGRVSRLGAYLHFGQISPVRVALELRAAKTAAPNRANFLDELIVRRELAINFVEYEPHYAAYEGLPSWARQTLAAHRGDKRPFLYDREAIERAETHDRYFNAAMHEMRITGYMHNYVRMYWGKKILEWSGDPKTAFATALALNNRYFLCGRDANSHANIGWCFGLHDRPWPQRPVFGTVRSMTAEGLKRKTDIEAYAKAVDHLVRQAAEVER